MTIKKFSVLVCLVEGSIIQSTSLEHEKYKLTKHSIEFSLSYSLNNPMCKNKFSKKKNSLLSVFRNFLHSFEMHYFMYIRTF